METKTALRQYLEQLNGKAVDAQFTGGEVVKGTMNALHEDVIKVNDTIGVIAHLVWIKPQK